MKAIDAIRPRPLTLREHAQLHREFMQEMEPLTKYEVHIRCLFYAPRFAVNLTTGDLQPLPEVVPDWAKPLLEQITEAKQEIVRRYTERATR